MSDDGAPRDDGKVGPFSRLLGFELVETLEDGVVLAGTPGPDHLNGGGIVHGGYLTALLDSASGWAVHVAMETQGAAPHTHLSVQFLRMAVAGEPLRCEARCVRVGRNVAHAEAEVHQRGRVVARAVSTHAVLG